ncbi:MAG: TonB-dependent receptor [Muribaculaceae bacterium]|nr:TonB-dependent receptor [Muribaculaceae bacterium]
MTALAQMKVSFTLHDNNGETVPYATVYIYHANDTVNVVSTGITDDNGRFSQAIKQAGKYRLKATFVGMDAAQQAFEVSDGKPDANLGTLVMGSTGNLLKGIEVTAQRQLVKTEIDRVAYDMQADADSKTNNVLEMLKKVPLVSVDGQDEIRVKGSTSFKIYRNGHPDPALGTNPKAILKAVPASMIKRIEVITDPGAKYDAEGTSAILNIVMVDNSQVNGATGTIGMGASMYGDVNGSANVTAQLGKVVTNVNYGYHRNSTHHSHNLQESTTHYNDTGNEFTTFNDSKATVNVHYGDVSASWEPDTLNLLSASAGGYYYDYAGTGLNIAKMTTSTGAPVFSYKINGDTPGSSFYDLHGRADFQHKTRVKDETLTLSYMVSTSRNHQDMNSHYFDIEGSPMPYTAMFTTAKERFAEHTFQFDWTRPFARFHKVETGLKYINRTNKSENTNTYEGFSEMNSHRLFNHLTQVGAAYVSYNYARDKWSARAGLRYEFSHLEAKYPDGAQAGYHRNLGDWVPNAAIEYKPDWFNSYKLSFSTNIQRPGITYLNPAVKEDPTTRTFGNSHLESAREYNISFTYMRLGAKLTFNVSPTLSFSSNQIVGVQYLEDGKQVSTYENTLRHCYAGLNAFAQWTIGPKSSLMFNGNAGYDINHSKKLDLDNNRWRAFTFAQFTQQLPWKLRLGAGGGFWMGGAQGLYGYNSGSAFYNLSLQRSFLKEDRLTVQLQAQNVFSGKYTTMRSHTTQGDYTGDTTSKWVGRNVSLNVSYRFGSLKARVKKTNTTIENNDVVGGSSQAGAAQGGQQGQQQ